jgi:hypothetical protein
MRLKLLLAPLMMILIIVSIIWFVVPAYQDVSLKRSELKDSEAKLEELKAKALAADKLVSDLQSKNAEQSTVLTYLPASTFEEQVIDNLNYIASNDGVSIYNLSVKEITPEALAAAGIAAGTEKSNPSLKKVEVSYGMVGGYDKIKSVLQKIFMLKRYNGVKSISIKKVFSPGSENKDASADNLQADVKLAFDYLEEMKTVENLDNAILTSGTFNMKAVNDIGSVTSVELMKLAPPAAGRANPFQPQ